MQQWDYTQTNHQPGQLRLSAAGYVTTDNLSMRYRLDLRTDASVLQSSLSVAICPLRFCRDCLNDSTRGGKTQCLMTHYVAKLNVWCTALQADKVEAMQEAEECRGPVASLQADMHGLKVQLAHAAAPALPTPPSPKPQPHLYCKLRALAHIL